MQEVVMEDRYCLACGSKFRVSEGTKQEHCSAECKTGGSHNWKKALLNASIKLDSIKREKKVC